MNNKKLTFEIFSKYRNIIMGLAIISILFFHFTEDCMRYNYNYNGFIKFYKIFIGSAGVDIFLFLSGLGLYYSWKKNKNYKEFMCKRIKRVIIPYLLISIPAFLIRDVLINNLGFLTVVKGITFYSFLTTGSNWFWYIFMIMICYLIFPEIYNIVEENKSKIKSHITLINIFTFITLMAIMLQLYNKPIFANLNIMLLRFPIFVFGAFVGRAAYEKRTINKEGLAFIILAIICIYLRNTQSIILIRYISALLFSALLFIIILLFEWFNNHKIHFKHIKQVLEWLGKYSLELYLTHVAVRGIINTLGYHTCRIRYYLLMLVLSIILSIFIKKITVLINKIFITKKNSEV